MTDVATIVLTALAITMVLQIVSIALIVDTRKKIKNESARDRQTRLETTDGKKQREADNRFSRRPQREQKNRLAPAQSHNVDQVERSLRDINLRLKNAERDQEKERKRLKDSMGSPGPRKFDHQRPQGREEAFRRNDRQRHEFHQNRTTDAQRRQRDDRGVSRNTFEIKDGAPAPAVQAPPPMPPLIPPSPQSAPQSAEPIFEAASSAPEQMENLQHGRKIMVKRRVLNVEEEKAGGGEDAAQQTSAVTAASGFSATAGTKQSVGPEAAQTARQENSQEGTISFGR